MNARPLLTLLLVFALGVASATDAAAHDAEWSDQWPRFSLAEGVATGALGVTAIVFGAVLEERREALWNTEILVDLPFRRMLGARRDIGERRAARWSDGLVLSLVAAPFVVDVGGAFVHAGNGDLAAQMAFISMESFAVSLALTGVTKILVGRARPRLARCFAAQLIDPTFVCDPRPTVSFFSGHSSAAFTGAGLLCAFGTNVPLYGDGFVNKLPCYIGLTAATTTAMLRVVANRHHFSDIFVGVAVGLASGWLLPVLAHFRESIQLSTDAAPLERGALGSIPLIGWSGDF